MEELLYCLDSAQPLSCLGSSVVEYLHSQQLSWLVSCLSRVFSKEIRLLGSVALLFFEA